MTDKPTFVFRDMMTGDEGYVQWMADKSQQVNGSLTKLVNKPLGVPICQLEHVLVRTVRELEQRKGEERC